MPKSLAIASVLVCLVGVSCSHASNHAVTVEPHPNSFSLKLQASELVGQCYAPKTFRYNGMLEFATFPGMNRWTLTQGDRSTVQDIEDLNLMLSAERVKIGSTIELSIRRDSISKRPSDMQFVAFPCDAPTKANAWNGRISIVAVRADLPTFYPAGYREPGAGDPDDMTGMMLNETPGTGKPSQRH